MGGRSRKRRLSQRTLGLDVMRSTSIAVMMLAVAIGAGIGALLRWALSEALNGRLAALPMGTLAANLIGAFFAGIALAWFATHVDAAPWLRLFVVTGILGGLTTFSTFSAENVGMLLAGDYLRSLMHASTHLFGSLAMTAFGVWLYKTIF